MRIAVLGGTGPAGRALATRLADLGHDAVVGSRDPERARGIVAEARTRWGDRLDRLDGATNEDAAEGAELVVLAFPWQAAVDMARALAPRLAGKVAVSMANAIERVGDGFSAVVPPEGSLAAAVAAAAPDARVVAALHHVPARAFADLDAAIDADVLVCSDDRAAASDVVELVAKIPRLHPVDVGGLHNAVGIEAFTAVMLSVNMRYKVRTGLRLTGLPR
jgi:hypothetical protein